MFKKKLLHTDGELCCHQKIPSENFYVTFANETKAALSIQSQVDS